MRYRSRRESTSIRKLQIHLFVPIHYNIVKKTLSSTEVTDPFGIELSQLQTGVGNNESLVSAKEEE